jgi:hypothetical protein
MNSIVAASTPMDRSTTTTFSYKTAQSYPSSMKDIPILKPEYNVMSGPIKPEYKVTSGPIKPEYKVTSGLIKPTALMSTDTENRVKKLMDGLKVREDKQKIMFKRRNLSIKNEKSLVVTLNNKLKQK